MAFGASIGACGGPGWPNARRRRGAVMRPWRLSTAAAGDRPGRRQRAGRLASRQHGDELLGAPGRVALAQREERGDARGCGGRRRGVWAARALETPGGALGGVAGAPLVAGLRGDAVAGAERGEGLLTARDIDDELQALIHRRGLT